MPPQPFLDSRQAFTQAGGVLTKAAWGFLSGLQTANSPVTAVTLNVTSGVAADSGGIKHIRVTTGSIGGSSDALVTVTWTTAFANANYTVVASVVDGTASASALSVVHIESVSKTAITVRVQNTSGGALTGTLQVIAMHD